MMRVLLALALIATSMPAQSVDLIRRERPNQTDVAFRTAMPHVSLEMGQVQTTTVHDGWAYLITDFRSGRWLFGAEVFNAPDAKFLSHTSAGGTIGYKLGERWTTSTRYVMYRNPDASFQRLYTTSLDYAGSTLGFGVSVGELTGTTTPIGQIRFSRNGTSSSTLLYASQWVEVPELPWATWTVNEVGVTHRLHFTKHVSVHIGTAHGLSNQRYTAFSIGLRVAK